MLSFDSQILVLYSSSFIFYDTNSITPASLTQQAIQSNVNVRLLPNAPQVKPIKFVAGGHLTCIKMCGAKMNFFDFPVIRYDTYVITITEKYPLT